jgi:hypothetical protein
MGFILYFTSHKPFSRQIDFYWPMGVETAFKPPCILRGWTGERGGILRRGERTILSNTQSIEYYISGLKRLSKMFTLIH